MDIGPVRRRFTAEPLTPAVPGRDEVPREPAAPPAPPVNERAEDGRTRGTPSTDAATTIGA